MANIRVYELAKELKVDSAKIIHKLEELSIPVKSHASALNEEQVKQVKDAILGPNPQEIVEKRIKPGIIRRRAKSVKKERPPVEGEPAKRAEDAEKPEGKCVERAEAAVAAGKEQAEKKKNSVEAKIVKKAPQSAVSAPQTGAKSPTKAPRDAEKVKLAAEKGRYIKPLLAKEQAAKLVQVREDEGATEKQAVKETEDKEKKKRGKKKGAKDTAPDSKKIPKKTVGRKKEIITRRDFYDSANGRYRPGRRRKKPIPRKMMKKTAITTPRAQKRIIKISNSIQVGELARRMGIKAAELIKKLVDLGAMATINQFLEFDEASLVAADYGYEVENVAIEEETILKEDEGKPEDFEPRPPIVTVMGHVDHGKTTLLDTIRKTNVVEGEKGGITQHIGAYTVELKQGNITFIDTPGHEAFTAMRARGAQATDLVILVVAADDGVMDRTREALDHARAAEVPIIVAVNKVDKPGANPEKVRRQLADIDLTPEDWGGDTMFVDISAKQGTGVPELLEAILLQSEVLELKANPKAAARGVILESRMDKGRGPVATALVQAGKLKAQDTVICGKHWGKVRAMMDESGNPVKEAAPSSAVQFLGLSGVPLAGDELAAVNDDKVARQVIAKREEKAREKEAVKGPGRISLEELYEKIQGSETKELNIIIKTDVQGSEDALSQSLEQLSGDKCKVNIVHSGVGAINENDIMLASASNAMVVGFNVKTDAGARKMAEHDGVEIRLFGVIYELIDEIKKAMVGTLDAVYEESVMGHAEVRAVFAIAKTGKIAGSYITDGKMVRNAMARVTRDGREIWKGKIAGLKRFKDDVREVAQASECGIKLDTFNDAREGDIIEAFELKEVQPTL